MQLADAVKRMRGQAGHQGHRSRSCARADQGAVRRLRSCASSHPGPVHQGAGARARASSTSASASSRSRRRRTWWRRSRSSTRTGSSRASSWTCATTRAALLSSAVEVSEKFLGDGKLVVYTEGRVRNQNMRFSAHAKRAYHGRPAGGARQPGQRLGLRDRGRRAPGLGPRRWSSGTQTFGKGSVQTIIPLSDGSGLRLTTAKYFTPKGRSIHGKGITPDIVIDPPKDDAATKPGAPPLSESRADEAGRPAPARDRDSEGVPDPRQDEADREGRLERRRIPAGDPAGRDPRPGLPGG